MSTWEERMTPPPKEHLIRSQFAIEIGTAREIAEAWKQVAIAKGLAEVTN